MRKVKFKSVYSTEELSGKRLTKTESYDPFGKMLVFTWYSEGKISGKVEYEYDSQERLIKKDDYISANEIDTSTKYSYDEYGRLLQVEISYMLAKGDSRTIKNYVYIQNSIEITSVSEKGKLEEKTVEVYTSAGLLQSKKVTDSKGKHVENYELKYDEKNQLISKAVNNLLSADQHNLMCQYDERGNCVQEDYYNGRGKLGVSKKMQYNDDNKKVFELSEDFFNERKTETKTSYLPNKIVIENSYNGEPPSMKEITMNEDGYILKVTQSLDLTPMQIYMEEDYEYEFYE